MCAKHTEGMTRFVHGLALVSVLHQCQGFSGVCPFDPATSLRPPASTASFRQQQPPWRSNAAGARAPRRLGPSVAVLSSAAASGKSRSFRNTSCAWGHHPRGDNADRHHQRRQLPPRRCRRSHEDAIWRYRRRPTLPSSSPSSLYAVRGSSSSSSAGSSPGEVEVIEDEGVGGGGVTGDLLAADHDKKTVLPTRARRPKKGDKKKKEKKDKSVLGKAGDALKATFNVFMAASTVVSLALAAEAVWQLHGTQLTLSNAVPTLTKLLPLTGIGVFGAAQLVGLVARVVRVIVTLPIMLSGTWVILQNAPKLLPQGSDLGGAGSLAALLATPEVLEAAAVLALLGGTAVWALNFATGAVGALISGQRDSSQEEFEDEDDEALG